MSNERERTEEEGHIMFVREFQAKLEIALLSLRGLNGRDPSREKALVVTKVSEAIMWLEEDLKRLGRKKFPIQVYDPSKDNEEQGE